MRHTLTLLLAIFIAPETLASPLPRPDHVVVVIEENRGYAEIMAPLNRNSYIHALARRGALFTESYGVTHPSQPNYLALFSGSTQGVVNDDCPQNLSGDNLAAALLSENLGFASYSEALPVTEDKQCISGAYRRKHNPAANWQSLPASVNRNFDEFARDFAKLPAVSFVIPDQNHDMHDGSFPVADAWLKTHIEPYLAWAYKHNSLLILTWDEDDYKGDNRIVTILAGPMVKAGTSGQRISHYNVLRTLLDFYGLPAPGASRDAEPIKGIWK
jgi:acid phosphatase